MACGDMPRYGAGMAFSLARSAHNATNSLHSLIYFVPETEQQLTGLGLRAGRMCYFAGRSAPMGAVGAGVVTATFYNFSPHLVARSIPLAWDLASPDAVAAARLVAADAALRRLLGPDVIASADMTTMSVLLRDAAGACSAEGRPLYAGHADLDWPDAPHLVMWHAVSLLREYRGDGHTCALAGAGLNGIEALVTHTATGKGFTPQFARASRGWSQDEWDSAVGGLAARDLLDGQGALTPAGQALRAQVEDQTDRLAAPPWHYLGERQTEEVVQIGKAMTRAVAAAGAFPREGVFATR
jgi:Helix-turn-helix family